MDRNDDDTNTDWSPHEVAWDGLTLTAQNSGGIDANVPTIDNYYIKGRGAANSGSSGGTSSSSCRVPGCTSDLSRDLAYFRKYRICREHLKAPVLVVEGVPSRFCQQCSRFHHVKEFDGPQRTCRTMLERLRIKRNISKNQAAARSGRVKNDTRPADTSRRGGSCSRSNSTGKDAEPPQDLASGQPQQRSHAGAAPTDSCEGVESITPLVARAAVASRHNGDSSAATATSFPTHANIQNSQQKPQEAAPDLETLLQCRQWQGVLPQGQGGDRDPRIMPPLASTPGRPIATMPRGGGNPTQQQALLQLYLSHDAAPVQQPSRILAGGSSAATAAALLRSSRIAGYDTRARREMPDISSPSLLYRDASYGRSAGVDGGGGSSSGGLQGDSFSAAALAELRPRPAPPQPEPLRLGECDGRQQLGGGGRQDSLLLQLAMTRGLSDRSSAPKHEPVLELGRPPAPVGPVLSLGSRVDLSLELQLQDIYREMAISDAVVPLQPRQEDPLLRSLSSGAPLGHYVSSKDLIPMATSLPQEPLLPLGHRAAAPLSQLSEDCSAIRFGQQQHPMGAAASAVLGPPQQQQRQQHQRAFSELSTALGLAAGDSMDMDTDYLPLPMSLAARSAPEAPAPPGLVASAYGVGPLSNSGSRLDVRQQVQQQQHLRQQHHHQLRQQQQQQHLGQTFPEAGVGASGGMGMVRHHDGSRAVGGSLGGNNTTLTDPRTVYDSNDGAFAVGSVSGGMYCSMYGGGDRGGSSADMVMAAIPEAGDGSMVSWSGDDIDAALDMLMEEAGSGAVYHTENSTASLERICFKLHNLHPCDLPPDLMGAMGSWLAAARAEVVQGAVRPGCTLLVLDVYANGPDPANELLEEGNDDGDTTAADRDDDGSGAAANFTFANQSQAGNPPTAAADEAVRTEADLKASASSGGKGRILGGLVLSEHEVARLEAAAAAAGAEALQPIPDLHYGSSASEVTGNQGGISESTATHLGAYVMHTGNVRAATACYKKLLGPRAVQAMSVSVRHEVLTISSRGTGRYVADVRGTMAGLDTPLLLSVSPLAVVTGTPAAVRVIGSHLVGPRRRPQVRCQGAHVPCSVMAPQDAATSGGAGGAAGSKNGRSAFQKVPPDELPAVMGQLLACTLPGSHRAEAVAECAKVDLVFEVPDAGLLMVEWEADSPSGGGGISLSDWLPLLSVPDVAMALEINKLEHAKDGKDRRVRLFLNDLGLVLDYVTRISHHALMPISTLLATGTDATGEDAAGCGSAAGGGGGGCDGAVASSSSRDFASWQSRSGGGGADQRSSPTSEEPLESAGGVAMGFGGGGVNPYHLEHDSRTELMTKPRLSKKHYNRVAALTPALLAFATDSGMSAVMAWLLDFMLEHLYFGDLAAVFQSVESVGGGPLGLPLLHRAVRSGNPRAVRLLLHRAASHSMACNLAQPAGPFHITPLHLAALQPLQSGMLQTCGCFDPRVAELWATLPDAAGRTPAMYLQRQLEQSLHAGSAAVALRVAAQAVTADPTRSDDSASGSTSVTGYRSWGSEERSDPALTAAAAANLTGHALGAAGGPPPPPLPTAVALGAASVERRGDGGDRDGVSGHGGGGGVGDGRDDAGDGIGDSAEEFRERRDFRRRGGRLADLGAEAMMATMTASEEAAPPSGGSDLGDVGMCGGREDLTAEALAEAGAAEAAPQCHAAVSEQGNGRAPLQVLARMGEVCSGAVCIFTGLQAGELNTTAPAAAAAAAELGLGLSGHKPSAGSGLQSGIAATAATTAVATADNPSFRPCPKARIVASTTFTGDSTEDWTKMKLSLRARKKQQDATQQHKPYPWQGGRGAGGSGSGSDDGGVRGNGANEDDGQQGREGEQGRGEGSPAPGKGDAASAATREVTAAMSDVFRGLVGAIVATVAAAAAAAAARGVWLGVLRGAPDTRVGRGGEFDGRFLGRPLVVTVLTLAVAVAVGMVVALVSQFSGRASVVDP